MRTSATLAALLALPFAVLAQPGGPRFESELVLRVGETEIVATGPVQRVVCDRGDVVERVATSEGNGFRGLVVGETTCTLQTADGVRRTFHVKVVERRQKEGEGEKDAEKG